MEGPIALFRTALQLSHAYNEPWEARSMDTVKLLVCSVYKVIWEH